MATAQSMVSTKVPLQRRLRHLFSLEIRNFSLVNAELNSHVLLYFTLQSSSSSPVLYASERLPVTVDLAWGGFNIKSVVIAKKQSIVFEQQALASRCICVRVWKYDQISQTNTILIEYNVDMVDLIPFNAAAYVTHGLKYAPNTLVVSLVHGITASRFAFVLPTSPGSSLKKVISDTSDQCSSGSTSPNVEVAQESLPAPFLSNREKKSYKLTTIVRMTTVARALRQSTELAKLKQNEIENKLAERINILASEQARERLRSEVEQMKTRQQKMEDYLLLRKQRINKLRVKTAALRDGLKELEGEVENLVSWSANMEHNFVNLADNLKGKRKLVHWRRGQMIADVHEVYPIRKHGSQGGLCSIAAVHLPDAVLLPKTGANPSGTITITSPANNSNANNTSISVQFSTISLAIGYAAHYLLFIHWLFGIQPRYRIVFRGSHSAIFDHIHTQLTNDSDRTFPLYFQDRSSYQRFRYAIFLLARTASQLRYDLTQKKQNCSGAQLLENIQFIIYDLFLKPSLPRPVSSARNHNNSHQGDVSASPYFVSLSVPSDSDIMKNEISGSVNSSEQGRPLSLPKSEASNSPMSSIWAETVKGDSGSGVLADSPSRGESSH